MGKILKGKWPEEDHLQRHKRWFNNLIELLSDLQDGTQDIPRNEAGVPQWSEMSINFLIQWATINASRLTHKHGEENEVPI